MYTNCLVEQNIAYVLTEQSEIAAFKFPSIKHSPQPMVWAPDKHLTSSLWTLLNHMVGYTMTSQLQMTHKLSETVIIVTVQSLSLIL